MYDIAEILRTLLDRHSNTSVLDREFKEMLLHDSALSKEYAVWCDEMGYERATGYRDYIDEIIESQDSIWDHYKEYGNDL
ncbi:MAG: hypothetical protein IJ808_06380 [Muribaculaceae bacterium]|nr:hypothetical protein [Muribaculaceae bacterium]